MNSKMVVVVVGPSLKKGLLTMENEESKSADWPGWKEDGSGAEKGVFWKGVFSEKPNFSRGSRDFREFPDSGK